MSPHGTYSRYTNGKCRCAECRAANVVKQRDARQRRRALLESGEIVRPHGVYSTYGNYGCRCDECRQANQIRNQRLRAMAVPS